MSFRGNEQARTRRNNYVNVPKKYQQQFAECTAVAVSAVPELQSVMIEPIKQQAAKPKWATRELQEYELISYQNGRLCLSEEFFQAAGAKDGSINEVNKLHFVGLGTCLELTANWPLSDDKDFDEIAYDDLSDSLKYFST